MTVHEIVQNIIEEFELTQKYVEAVRNERSAAFEGHADESQAEERLIDALREGRVRIDRERDRLNRSDPGFARTDGFAPYNSGLILANLERTLDQSLADFKRHFKEQIAGSLRPPTPRPNQRFVPNKKLGDWYIVTIETTVNVVNNLVIYTKNSINAFPSQGASSSRKRTGGICRTDLGTKGGWGHLPLLWVYRRDQDTERVFIRTANVTTANGRMISEMGSGSSRGQ